MTIANRHIRHDYQQWVDWDQKSVRTLCGKTTKRHLAGIPTVTHQPEIVQTPTGKKWGWCPSCAIFCYQEADRIAKVRHEGAPAVFVLYANLLDYLEPMYQAYRERRKHGRYGIPNPV